MLIYIGKITSQKALNFYIFKYIMYEVSVQFKILVSPIHTGTMSRQLINHNTQCIHSYPWIILGNFDRVEGRTRHPWVAIYTLS